MANTTDTAARWAEDQRAINQRARADSARYRASIGRPLDAAREHEREGRPRARRAADGVLASRRGRYDLAGAAYQARRRRPYGRRRLRSRARRPVSANVGRKPSNP